MSLRTRAVFILAAAGALWCVGVGFWIWFTPVASHGIVGGTGQPDREFVEYHAFSDVSMFGALPLVVPAALALLAAWSAWRGSRVGVVILAVLFAAFTFVAGFSIGAAYVPAAGLLLWAALVAVVEGFRAPPRS
jgi:hypothetical protein